MYYVDWFAEIVESFLGGCRKLFSTKSKLRDAREARGWSQESVAEKLGVDTCTYRRWESGVQKPHWWNARKLGELFHMTVSDLYREFFQGYW